MQWRLTPPSQNHSFSEGGRRFFLLGNFVFCELPLPTTTTSLSTEWGTKVKTIRQHNWKLTKNKQASTAPASQAPAVSKPAWPCLQKCVRLDHVTTSAAVLERIVPRSGNLRGTVWNMVVFKRFHTIRMPWFSVSQFPFLTKRSLFNKIWLKKNILHKYV